jgi:hypothetical protein
MAFMKTYIDFMRIPIPPSENDASPYEIALANEDGC